MMTGDFKLVKAAPDSSCGIGFLTAEAPTYKAYWGQNLLGRALEKRRAELQASIGHPLPRYAFKFWRLREEMLNEERYFQIRSRYAKLPAQPDLPREIVWPKLLKYQRNWPASDESLLTIQPKYDSTDESGYES